MDGTATSLPGINFDTVTSRDEERKAVESMCNDAVTVMHECCSSVDSDKHDVYNGRFKPNCWWNSACMVTRDRQRLWYVIWKSCGRPRVGHAYILSSSPSFSVQCSVFSRIDALLGDLEWAAESKTVTHSSADWWDLLLPLA